MPKESNNYPVIIPANGSKLNSRRCSLEISEEMTMDEWVFLGRDLYQGGQRMTWWLADWAAFGERRYGKLKEFCEANGMNYGTVRNLASVAGAVELSRRRDNLSFGHHVEVAGLEPREQTKWLGRAEKEKWAIVELRRQIRASTATDPPEKTLGPADQGVEVQKIFLDASVIFDRKLDFVKENAEEVWGYAAPFVRKIAKLFPERIVVNEKV